MNKDALRSQDLRGDRGGERALAAASTRKAGAAKAKRLG